MNPTVAGSTPYAWPYDASMEASRLALVVVLPGSDGAVSGEGSSWPDPVLDSALDAVLGRIADLAGAVHANGGVVVEVTTAPRSRGGPATPRLGATGLKGDAHRVVAGGIDGFFASPLDATLRSLGRDQLLVCGQWLETNVHSTMRSANDRGYECLLVLDACAPLDPDLVASSRSQVEMSGGIFGAVGETTAVLDALLPRPHLQKELT
ncbi:cysteine hydrolase [Nocardioides sp. AN3]